MKPLPRFGAKQGWSDLNLFELSRKAVAYQQRRL